MSDKSTLYGQLLLTEASSSQNGLFLDDSSLSGTPPGFDYASVTEIQDYSNLRLRWWQFEGGLKHLFTENVAFEYAVTYSDLNDYQPYLADRTGSRLGMLSRLNWLF